MPSTNKTETIGLNQWIETDRPQRGDFNNDNLLLEDYIVSHTTDADIHLTSAEKARVKSPIVTTVYLGDGGSSRTVTLPVAASLVIVFAEDKPSNIYDSSLKCTKVYKGMAIFGGGSSGGVALNSGAIVVKNNTEATNGVMYRLNEEGVQYSVVAVR